MNVSSDKINELFEILERAKGLLKELDAQKPIPPTAVRPEIPAKVTGPLSCPYCEGSGSQSNTAEKYPWNFWVRLANRLDQAFNTGALAPVVCEHCSGDGHLHTKELDELTAKQECSCHVETREHQDVTHCPFCESDQNLVEDSGRWVCEKCRGVIFGGPRPGLSKEGL